MNDTLGYLSRVSLLGSLLALPAMLFAQAESTEEETFELSPFEVTTGGDIGYGARDTLAGTRLRTDLRDVANAVQVVNAQFLQDTGATDQESLLVYTTNTEVGGVTGNFAGVGDGSAPNDAAARTQPQSNTRVRGLAAADNTRNFFLTSIPWDGYNVNRVDIQRGANAVLFGIGSPAGIINTDLIDAEFFNSGKVEFRVGSYGSLRANFDVNQQIIEDQLAIRIAGVYDDTQYQQDPAYETERRFYITSRYSPEGLKTDWAETTFNVSYEKGSIDANRPRILPPEDRITPWFSSEVNQLTVDPRLVNLSSKTQYEELGSPASYGLTARSYSNTENNGEANPNYNPWIERFAPVYGPVAIFPNPSSPEQTGFVQVQGVDFVSPRPVTFPPPSPSLPFNQWVGIVSYRDYGTAAGLPGENIGAIKNRSLRDPSVYNFYKNLLDGPTKSEEEDFESYSFAVQQTFFDDVIGVEYVNDYQLYDRENTQAIADDGYALSVDMQQYLYNSSTGNDFTDAPVPNPNVGRPMVAARGQNGFRQESESRNERITVFANLDVSDLTNTDNFLTRFLGRHVITGVYTDSESRQDQQQWYYSVVGPDYLEYNTYGLTDYSDGRTSVGTVSYLGGDLRGISNASDAQISRIGAARIAQSGTTQLFDWTVADSSIGRNPVNLARYVGYRDTPMPIIHSEVDGRDGLYNPNSVSTATTINRSKVVVWQGYFLDDLIVPSFAWREDTQGYDYENMAGNTNNNNVRVESTTWGIVVHTPDFIKRRLPAGLNLDLFYNDSSNLRPDASRVDLYGNALPSPSGETKDYGFTISAFEDRYTFKVNWYETTVKNADLSSAISNNYIVGFGEFWAYQFASQARLATQGGADGGGFGPFTQNYALYDETDPDTGNTVTVNGFGDNSNVFLAYERAPGQSFQEALDQQNLAIDTLFANLAPQNFQDAWNFSYAEWDAGTRTNNPGAGGIAGNLAVVSTNVSKGVEFEFNAQITDNWNLTFNVAKTEAIRDDIAENYAIWVEDRFQLYQGPAGDVRFWNGSYSGSQTESMRAKFTREFYGNYLQQRQLQGSIISENRKWRFNLVTNYNFTESFLKGVNVGAAYRWQDAQVVGYPVLPDPITGYAYDVENPIMGPEEDNLDLWIGYERPLTDKIDWRIQLNIRNAFGDNELIPVTVQPDGSPGISRIQDGQSWFLTNTFSF